MGSRRRNKERTVCIAGATYAKTCQYIDDIRTAACQSSAIGIWDAHGHNPLPPRRRPTPT